MKLNKIKNTTIATAAIAVMFGLAGCGESTSSSQGSQFGQSQSTPTPPTDDFNQTRLLENLTDNVVVPTYTRFAELALEQQQAVTSYCQALVAQNASATEMKTGAQQSWRNAMATWQMAEVMQIGPLLENSNTLRNKIYSWPNVSACAVDQDVVLSEQANYDIASRTATRRGLDALEYLLFNPNLNHSCTVFGTEPQGWNNRTDQDRAVTRCEFAQQVSTDLVNSSTELVNAWKGTAGQTSYADTLKTAGEPGSQFTDVHQAVNDVSDAIFYIDTLTKDAKLATPVGLFANDCGLQPCAQNVESQFANHSLQNVIANIRALNLLFLGGDVADALGFDDYLVDVGDEATATKMANDLREVIEFAESLQLTMAQLLEQNPDQVEQVHDQLKEVTDQLKTDFIQSLALELPATSAGDND